MHAHACPCVLTLSSLHHDNCLCSQEMKSCDTDLGGCGLPNRVNHFLQAAPRVFTLHVRPCFGGCVS